MNYVTTGDTTTPPITPLSPTERTMIRAFDEQRRLQLLRVLVPGITIIIAFNAAFSVLQWNAMAATQIVVGVVVLGIAFIGTFTNRVTLASLALLIGTTAGIMLVILFNAPWHNEHMLDVRATPEFFLLLFPILIAGLVTGPRALIATTIACFVFSAVVIRFTAPAPFLVEVLHHTGGSAIIAIPLITQLGVGFLMLLGMQGFYRVQRELADLHVAYAREKELDRLKDQFIASVNHELRTPIMALQGYIEIAQELGARGEMTRQGQMLRQGHQAAADLVVLVRSVLNVRRTETDAAALHMHQFALAPAISGTLGLLDPRDLTQHAITVTVPADLSIYADEERLQQIMLNLLTNAIKYSAPDTPIAITARRNAATRPRSRLQRRHMPMITIAVRDQGLGIPPDQAALIFERFVRLDRDIASQTTGTGLGLALCRSYVEAMGGHIWVESSGVAGEGATFSFTLPAEPGDIVISD